MDSEHELGLPPDKDPDLPIFAYWDRPDHTPIAKTLADWQPRFAAFRVIGDAEIVPLLEQYFPEHRDTYLAIRIPQAKSDVARLLALYQWGGLYVDCHFRINEPDGVWRLIRQLNQFEAVFVDRDLRFRKPDTHWIINGCMLARPKSNILMAAVGEALRNLERQREDEQRQGFVPYNIFVLTGSVVMTAAVTEPGSEQREIRRDLAGRILIVREEELPIQRSVWKDYISPGSEWHVRQKTERLFAPSPLPAVQSAGADTSWWRQWAGNTVLPGARRNRGKNS